MMWSQILPKPHPPTWSGGTCVLYMYILPAYIHFVISIMQITSNNYQRRAPPTVPRPFPFPSTPSLSHPHPHSLAASLHHSTPAPYYQTSAVPRPQPPYPSPWEAPTCNSNHPITKLLQSTPLLLPLLKLPHRP